MTAVGSLDVTKWIDDVRAVVLGFMPGEAAGKSNFEIIALFF